MNEIQDKNIPFWKKIFTGIILFWMTILPVITSISVPVVLAVALFNLIGASVKLIKGRRT